MLHASTHVPPPVNEPVLSYAPNTPERQALKNTLVSLEKEQRELAMVIHGEKRLSTTRTAVTAPHRHQDTLATLHHGSAKDVQDAIESALQARASWADMSFDEKASIFLKAADLLSGRYRPLINAATMLGQSKTAHQAEIDAACELADFWRFNVHFARKILEEQPLSSPGMWNRTDYRPLDGFVLAISPFNFTAIGGNLPTAPALMGNTVLWKPATTAALSASVVMDILMEAGLPKGVINMVCAEGKTIGETALVHPQMAGVHFTGSTSTFNHLWNVVAGNLGNSRCYPRLVGETGGKDFIVAHPSADVRALAVGMVRGAFEYQGQKCSAASRAYIPESLWPQLSAILEEEVAALKVGDVADFRNFMGAVIDAKAFKSITGYIEYARQSSDAKVWLGGTYSNETGYFIQPTVVVTTNPNHKLMVEEIFGPVLTIYLYKDADFTQTLRLVDQATPYALTGAVFAQDKHAVAQAMHDLRFAAGNFYINDKPTGAVVGQQPFGGSRASGTNDKAGSMLNLLRWTSPRTLKETFDPPRSVGYPFMQST
jgi:1-pyrroline-5-carboxylate dehydrogenase